MNNIQKRTEQLKVMLQHILNDYYKDLAVKNLEIAGSGVQNVVFRGESVKGDLAFRVPWSRQVENINEDAFSSRHALQKEAKLSAFCHLHYLPIPKVHELHISEELDFLISDFVTADNIPISSYNIGKLVNRLHHLSIDGLEFENKDSNPLSRLLAERIEKRMNMFRKITNYAVKLPSKEEVEHILKEGDTVRRLLHMDTRPANLIGCNGEVEAIVDWDNALIGHPLLDLMRIAETNEVDWNEFKKGYGNDAIFESLSPVVSLFYRLDTAVMLANLFTAQLKMENEGIYYQKRVQMICRDIHRTL